MTDLRTFSYTSTCEIRTLSYNWSLKKSATPYRASKGEVQLNLSTTATLGTEESGHCREVERKVNVWTVRQKKWLLVAVRLHSPTDLSECFSAKYVDYEQNTLVSYKLWA